MRNEGSSDRINYLVRPAKQVERKLIIEALGCIGKKYDIPSYTYVGMGSRYFVDFQMVHKFLGIKDMISFEKDEYKIKRFEFNRPYEFISLKPGVSTQILPNLDWSKDFIIWLDYDQKISPYMIDDIEIVCDSAKPGTILILTIDAEPRRFDGGFPEGEGMRLETRLRELKETVHPHHPPDIKKSDLSKKKFPGVLMRIVRERVRDRLAMKDLNFFQLFNFIYEDSSQMYTFGCIFEKRTKKIEDTGVYDLSFVSKDDDFERIVLPILTPREKMYFDRLAPDIANKLERFEMDADQIRTYERYYRYYPQYFETYI
jgi:hypothetical protein